MNKIIHSTEEVYNFFNIVLPPIVDDEVYFISLSARNKYLTEEEKKYYHLGRSEMFCRQIIREYNFEKFVKTLKGFERNEGAYLTKNSKNIPQNCMVCYININPSSTLKTYKEFNSIMTDYLYESIKTSNKTDVMKRITKMNTLLLNCYQKNRGRKIYIDINFDIPKDNYEIVKELTNELEQNNITHFVISTKSGYHVLLKRDTIKYNFTKKIAELNVMCPQFEIIVNKNEMIPCPGTYQGDFPVRTIQYFGG